MADAAQGRSRTPAEMVREFYVRNGLPIRNAAGLVFDDAEVDQMLSLLKEEFGELSTAIEQGNLVKVVDGLADVVYVAYGMALQYGVDLDRAILAVHQSNMTKIDREGPWSTGLPRKVARGSEYQPPDLGEAIKGGSGSGVTEIE